jgi:hypothetical protein
LGIRWGRARGLIGEEVGKISTSDLVGGTSTIRGINYQLNFAVLKALELIGVAKNSPHKRCSVSVEPRRAGDEITAWDIQTSPPDCLIEAKLANRC